jgi:hypothetical protein
MPKPLLPKSTIAVIAELLSATVRIDQLTPDTRPSSIRDAVGVLLRIRNAEQQAMLTAIIMQAYGISLPTVDAIARDLRAQKR